MIMLTNASTDISNSKCKKVNCDTVSPHVFSQIKHIFFLLLLLFMFGDVMNVLY